MKNAMAVVVVCGVVSTPALAQDVVLQWNDLLLDSVADTGLNPPRASRSMAMVHTAVYDAVNSIGGIYEPYHVDIDAPIGTSKEAAAAVAAHDVLVHLFQTRAGIFDAALINNLNAIPDGQGKDDGIALGRHVASQIISLRANDGSNAHKIYVPGNDPGDWRPTPPGFAPALLPQWPDVTPFAMTSGDQFRPGPPPSLNSAEYTTAFNEVYELGRIDSQTRTQEQTDIAHVWAGGPGTPTPPGQWNEIAAQIAMNQGNSIEENARMFALLNLATADAAISAWDAKYAYDFWRPVTGIQEGDTDGNPDTIDDDLWMPLITTPPFPSYTSGHSTFSSAAATILALFYGTDNIDFVFTAEDAPGIIREFESLWAAAEEAGQSRIYGGIHWQFDNVAGLDAGSGLGNYIFQNFLVPAPSSLALLGMGGLLAARRRRTV